MKLVFSEHAWEDYQCWVRTDRRMLKRVDGLIQEIGRDPFSGVGKPEPLQNGLSGYWSRRLDDEHRIVYRMSKDAVLIAQLRYHC
jgi:toxin YoeB